MALEENSTKLYQARALEEAREAFPKYFEALTKHPRLLVGTEVPAIGRDGMETLRDSRDAEDWQGAVKQILSDEIRDRAAVLSEGDRGQMDTLHASIELFQKNTDLVPNTRQFDRELADKFAQFTKPYEMRVDGKLYGYSVPVQPIIDQLRTQLAVQRQAQSQAGAAQAAPGTPATPGAGVTPPPAVDPPQAGISSKAGTASEAEDFSVLFGTLGLPNLRI